VLQYHTDGNAKPDTLLYSWDVHNNNLYIINVQYIILYTT